MKRTNLINVLIIMLFVSALIGTRPAIAAPALMDLGTLGGHESQAMDINNSGQIVGGAQTETGETHAFLWQKGVMTDLGTADGVFSSTTATAINDRGQVAGWGLIRSDGMSRGFIWENGVMTVLGTLAGSTYHGASYIYDLNNSGIAVGASDTSTGGTHAFRYTDGEMTDLGDLGGGLSYATAINARGWIAGFSNIPSSGNDYRPVVWKKGTVIVLGISGGTDNQAESINERGDVVGYSAGHAILWRNGTMIDLQKDYGFGYGIATDINNPEQVVGEGNFLSGDIHGFFWEKGVFTDLGTLGGMSTASAINEQGQVVGYSKNADNYWHAFLWSR